MHCSSYTRPVFDPDTVRAITSKAVRRARSLNPVAVAASGFSGLPIASLVAYRLRVPLIAVRQPGTCTHNGGNVLNSTLPADAVGPYLILDDLISTGATVGRIVDAVEKYYPELTLSGILLYTCSEGDDNRVHALWGCRSFFVGVR